MTLGCPYWGRYLYSAFLFVRFEKISINFIFYQDSMKDILLITHSSCGGVERMTLLYAKILQQAGFDSRMLIVQNPSEGFDLKSFIPPNIPYNLIHTRYRYLYFHVVRYILYTKPSCVFYSFPLLVPALIFSKILMPKLKVVCRDCNMPTRHQKKQSYPAKYIMQYADAIIAQTKEMKQEMAEFYHVDSEKITVINNPLDKELIQNKIRETYQYSFPRYTHYVAVSRLAPQKDYITMIKAFSIVLKQYESSQLDIIGNTHWDKDYTAKVYKIIEELGIGRHIAFHGFQENPFKYMDAADVFVLSSIHEGLPNVMLEAMYLGKPVVVTRSIPYISQVVHDGMNGYTVPVGDCEKLADAMIKARKLKMKEKFVDVNSSERQIIELFEKTLEK